MNARERFRETMHFGTPDRVPFYDQPIREDVLERWYEEGFPRGTQVADVFNLDRWELLGPREKWDLEIRAVPGFEGGLRGREDWQQLKQCYDPATPGRYPANWDDLIHQWQGRDYPLGVVAWRGVLQFLDVGDWESLTDALLLVYDDPALFAEIMDYLGEFMVAVIGRALRDVDLDFALFEEPIASNHAPVLSPAHLRRFVLPAYRRVTDVLRTHGVDVIIVDTQAHVTELIPIWLEAGINGLWCSDARAAGVDYVELGERYGRDLVLIGGIDVRALAGDEAAIRREILSQVPTLLERGGYVPLVDDRIRAHVPYRNYCFYRDLIALLAGGG